VALSWCKVASNLDTHPKVRKAGRNGREVFLFALRRNAEPGNPIPGRIPKDELEPCYLADLLQMPECDAVTGVTAAVTAGLLALEGDSYAIVSWKDGWGKDNGTGAERTARYRENKKLQAAVTGVTSHIVTPSHGDACDIEEKRLEEKREHVSGKPDAGLAFAEKAIGLINSHAGTKYQPDSASVLKLVKALIKNRHTPEQAELVIRSKRAWVGDPKMGQFFRPATLLAATNFANYLADLEAGPQQSQGGQLKQCEERPSARSPLMLAFDLDEEEGADAVA
jgi:uncharacterized phage protein (TIGR02220 family)